MNPLSVAILTGSRSLEWDRGEPRRAKRNTRSVLLTLLGEQEKETTQG